MLGRLATWLRILGYDAEYDRSADPVLLARARREDRVLLTRDTRLLRRRGVPAHLFIRSDAVQEQVREVLAALRLPLEAAAGPRCLRCNVLLEPRSRAEVEDRVPDYVWASQAAFTGCPRCGRIYWPGTHRQHMREAMRALEAGGDAGASGS